MSLKEFQYAGPNGRIYPFVLTDEGPLVVEPGDVREFESPPDGYWVAVAKPVKTEKKADS